MQSESLWGPKNTGSAHVFVPGLVGLEPGRLLFATLVRFRTSETVHLVHLCRRAAPAVYHQ